MSWLVNTPLTRFIAQIVVILATARLIGYVGRRVRQPPVVAEILAGIVLGPSLLGWALPSAHDALFAAGPLQPLRSASELGLVLFVFLIGLEIDSGMLRGRLRTSFAIAFTSVAAPFLLGAALTIWLYNLSGPNASRVEFALFVGTAMSVTAFPVLACLLLEHRLLRTPVGAIAVACAAISDVFAWCTLAFVVAFARADGLSGALLTTASSLAFVAAILFGIRPLLERMVAQINAPLTVTRETISGVMIALFASAWLTERIGIHIVFGAFALGAVIPRQDGFARAIAEKLEDVVTIVLLPLFFAISGLRTSLELAFSLEYVAASLAVVAVAFVTKFGGTVLAARWTGLPWRDAGTLGILLNTRGLVDMIVLNIGLDLRIISPALFSMMVIMVLLSTVVTSPILRRIYPLKEVVRELLADDPAPARPGHRVLTCVSHDRVGPSLIAMAHSLVGSDGEAIALYLDRVDARSSSSVESHDPTQVLEPALARARELGLATRSLAFSSMDIANDIARVAEIRDVELVLLGLHKPLLSQALLGGIAHEVLRQAAGTVAIYVDRGAPMPPNRVLVLFQRTRHDAAALEIAGRIQRATGATIAVLAIDTGRSTSTSDLIKGFEARGMTANLEVVEHSSPADAAVERARAYDLVIVGVGREWGLRPNRVGVGFQPERLIRDCAASLLIVRGPLEKLEVARIPED